MARGNNAKRRTSGNIVAGWLACKNRRLRLNDRRGSVVFVMSLGSAQLQKTNRDPFVGGVTPAEAEAEAKPAALEDKEATMLEGTAVIVPPLPELAPPKSDIVMGIQRLLCLLKAGRRACPSEKELATGVKKICSLPQ